jgi:ferredoxin-NADP reductase
MERATLRRRLNWQVATVRSLVDETATTRDLVLELPDWPGHLAGQHVDVRLTAEDGYQAQRSYSIASAPEDHDLVLTVERLPDGEVSTYLVDDLEVGDHVELRGPIGEYFVWDGRTNSPLLLIAGGSGIVPFRAMLRHRAAIKSSVPVRLFCSARQLDDVIYCGELARYARSASAHWQGYRRRIDRDLIAEVAWSPGEHPLVFICGPSGFVETAAQALVDLGHDPKRVKTERFGPSGTAR